MTLPRLIAITDFERFSVEGSLAAWDRLARSARPGSVAVQLRGPTQKARKLLAAGARLAEIARDTGQALIVNDRLDLATLLRAEGVHLGEAGVSPAEARVFMPSAWVFRACHEPESVALRGADALVLSPVFEPRKGNAALGLERLTRAVVLLERAGEMTRVFALGGVTPENAAACLAAGAYGVAAIAGVFGASDPADWVSPLAIAP